MRGIQVSTALQDDVVIATLTGDIDLLNHEEVGRELFSAALAGGPRLVANLSAVSYIDSNGVRMLFGLARELDHSRIGWTVVLGDGSPLHRLFKVTNFDEVAKIFPSVEEAVDALRGRT
ncbi:MAG: anti-sigma factor antagonist [Actinomycetota bacterium]|jgi:stage II sporulation protein AA (anti-sigma F factor antagonist)